MGDASSILGWMSLACWIVVYSPQFIENYQLQSGEGLSIAFILIWLVGDLTNLLGALLAGLLPTVTFVALYYSLCDILLLAQIYYYRWKAAARLEKEEVAGGSAETTGLLAGSSSDEEVRVKTAAENARGQMLRNAICVLFVIGTGVAAWYFGPNKAKTPTEDGPMDLTSQILGYISMLLYLSSRIPQIFKNRETKCTGLSPVFFAFAMTGNITYVLSICSASMDKHYLLVNASWLAGSIGTILLDIYVLYQFIHYRAERISRERSAEIAVVA
ncbi:hypothetical protein BOTBODRAFT_466108 [Botryobasidium botryosum FD-172 SS1]|uniref:PQ-loop-domain-containing protein n=1 Tax=Botryobasidium botryosum (strain FD-172 SS1) TaxID=930990 RepID=A0A067MHQ3_BOTB1|nr:hypothetical protein BOTBODRAFT_466108 [Botryobasidium botryosum FD-172 SS1]